MRQNTFYLLLLIFTFNSYAQIGGQRAFEFLSIPNNARLSGLAGVNITSGWDDPTQGTSNPALINSNWNQELVVSYLGYFADIVNTSISYATNINKTGTWAFNLSYFNYGEIESYDEEGFFQALVSIKRVCFFCGIRHAIWSFFTQQEQNAKVAVSNLASFQASALMIDLGGTFKHPEKDMTIGLLVKNLGFLISDYIDINDSQLPLDIQLGFSYKPEFMPLRFSLAAKNLLRDDLIYFDPASNTLFGQKNKQRFSEEIFRKSSIWC